MYYVDTFRITMPEMEMIVAIGMTCYCDKTPFLSWLYVLTDGLNLVEW